MKSITSLISKFRNVVNQYVDAEDHNVVDQVLSGLGMPLTEERSGVWVTQPRLNHGFSIRLTIAFQGDFVILMAEASIVSPVEWVSRMLALRLLAENDNYIYGSNRLLEGPDSVTIVHAAVCDSRVFDASYIAFVGRTVANQMVQLVTRLYAMELIEPPSGRAPQVE